MTVVVESRVGCASPVEAMFDVVSDTDRLNRESGLPEISFAPAEKGSSRKIVKSSLGPLVLEYSEHPWEWVRPERIHVRREYRNGPLTILDVHFDFAADGQGSNVAVRLKGQPRPLMGPFLKIVLSAIAGKLGRAIDYFRRSARLQVRHEQMIDARCRLVGDDGRYDFDGRRDEGVDVRRRRYDFDGRGRRG